MPRHIIKLSNEDKDFYLEWSTVVDAPVTYGMSLEDFKDYWKQEYHKNDSCNCQENKFNKMIDLVEETGCSRPDWSLDDILSANRAGENEKEISKQEIIQKYCISPLSE